MSSKGIFGIIDRYRDEAFRLLGRLIEVDSVNPPGNEHNVAQVLSEEFEELGLKSSSYEKAKGRTNISCSIGEKNRPVFAIVCHSDTVPAGDGWTFPPFKATLKDGRVYGRGAADDKGPLVSAVLALKALKETKAKLKGKLMIIAAADEEKGSTYGVDYLLKVVGLRPDFAMVAEQTLSESLEIAEKGTLWLKLRCRGVQAHGSMPNLGVNAIQKLSKVLSAIGEFKMSYSPHPLLSGPTINIGTIKGGIAPNVVAGEAEAILDIRYLPSQTPEGIMKELNAFIESLRKQDPKIDVVVEKVSSQIPTEVSSDNGFVKVVSGAVRSVLGKEPKLIGIGGATVAKSYLSYGIPALMYGPGDEKIDHVANEYIELDQVITAAKVMALSALDLLN
ncbi:MAG TPA: M20 family metallopeptidase [Candidatus Bathyarchaeia archaeon]|nr:MAG: hypothetical protein A3K70_02060 [Candidatus Bathyarchaeota archaeon RBG_16_48_13]HJX23974.1 M20 family metallopeptidase [Candidatus Bathyarchaeia archaeon]